jgi:hypothetical protein
MEQGINFSSGATRFQQRLNNRYSYYATTPSASPSTSPTRYSSSRGRVVYPREDLIGAISAQLVLAIIDDALAVAEEYNSDLSEASDP